MVFLIDNGHGVNTPGKCSPDRRLQEWEYNRRVAKAVSARLQARGVDARLLVPESGDVPLSERVRRVEAVARKERCVLISVHVNAAGSDGRWHEACGWSGWVCRKASAASRRLCKALHEAAMARGLRGNRAARPDGVWEADFYLLRRTSCPAVLTENMFMDCRKDVNLLLSPEGFERVVSAHVEGVMAFIRGGL